MIQPPGLQAVPAHAAVVAGSALLIGSAALYRFQVERYMDSLTTGTLEPTGWALGSLTPTDMLGHGLALVVFGLVLAALRSRGAPGFLALLVLATGWGVAGHGLVRSPLADPLPDFDGGQAFGLNVFLLWPYYLATVGLLVAVVAAVLVGRAAPMLVAAGGAQLVAISLYSWLAAPGLDFTLVRPEVRPWLLAAAAVLLAGTLLALAADRLGTRASDRVARGRPAQRPVRVGSESPGDPDPTSM